MKLIRLLIVEKSTVIGLRAILLFLTGAAAVVLIGCHGTGTVTPSATAMDGSDAIWMGRMREFADATRGLTFTDDGITLTNPGDADPDYARQRLTDAADLRFKHEPLPAIAAYRDAMLAGADQPTVYLGLGDALIEAGQSDAAIAAYQTAAKLDTTSAEAQFQLAMALDRAARRNEALIAMQAVLDRDPDHAVAHEHLAVWMLFRGDPAASWSHVQAARKLNRDLPPQFITLLESRMVEPLE